jgi:hypothetical protein
MVNTIDRRVRKLEDRFGMGDRKQSLLLIVRNAGLGLVLDSDRCVQILGECGFLPTDPVGIVNLGQIPNGLNAEELETYLREDGAKTCGLGEMITESRRGGDA